MELPISRYEFMGTGLRRGTGEVLIHGGTYKVIRYFRVHKRITSVTDYYRCIDNNKAEIYNKKRNWWDTTLISDADSIIDCANRYSEEYKLTELTHDEFEATLIMEELIE